MLKACRDSKPLHCAEELLPSLKVILKYILMLRWQPATRACAVLCSTGRVKLAHRSAQGLK